MGCSGSKPEDASPSSSKKAGPGGRSLERENSSWVRPSEANRDARPVAGEATAVPRMRTRSRSVDFSGAGRAILPGQLDAKGPAAPELSQRASRASRGAAGRARSTDDITGAIRVQGYIVAKEEGGRKAGRIAVTSEGNLELRTQLARHQGKHAHFSPEEAEFVLETIGQHFLFKNMTKEQQTRCLQHFERRKLEAKETLTKQGEEGAREFYIVRDGSFEVSVTKTGDFTPTVVASLRKSAVLGEMALLYACKRTATVTATQAGEVYVLSREAYQLTLMDEDQGGGDGSSPNSSFNNKNKGEGDVDAASFSRLKELQSTSLWVYDLLPSAARRDLSKIQLDISVGPKVQLLQKGRIAGVLLVILSGEVQFTGDQKKKTRDGGMWRESAYGELCSDTLLKAGDVVALGRPGDEAMLALFHSSSENASGKLRCLGGTYHATTLLTKSAVRYLAIPMTELVHLIGPHSSIIASTDGRRALLMNSPWSKGLSKKEIDALAFACKPGVYSSGDVLVSQGEKPKHLHLIISGEVKVSRKSGEEGGMLSPSTAKSSVVCHALAGDVIGEKEFVTSEASTTTAVAHGEHTFCLFLDASDFVNLAPSHRLNTTMKSVKSSALTWPLWQQADHPFTKLNDLKVKAVVGAGAFAQVALVRHGPTSGVYALKKMNRGHLEAEKVVHQVMNERFVLGDFYHPCIAKLHATFKSQRSLMMLLEPCMGGELFTRMRILRRLDEPAACFYSACVVSAFEYLQQRSVLYRDLKPENVMIHADGYIRVVDFGFAKRVFTRTYTVCGTPEYLAPELLMMKGHGYGVDWWALGVLLYEMVVGVAPFCFHPETKKPDADLPPPELYKNILNPKYELPFPSRLTPQICEMIEQLLAWDPLTRLGCLTDGAEGVKRLAFFKSIDWQKLYNHQIPAPYMPELRGDDDLTNFEESNPNDRFLEEPPYEYKDAWDADF